LLPVREWEETVSEIDLEFRFKAEVELAPNVDAAAQFPLDKVGIEDTEEEAAERPLGLKAAPPSVIHSR
jgi:hypothetical protein